MTTSRPLPVPQMPSKTLLNEPAKNNQEPSKSGRGGKLMNENGAGGGKIPYDANRPRIYLKGGWEPYPCTRNYPRHVLTIMKFIKTAIMTINRDVVYRGAVGNLDPCKTPGLCGSAWT